MQLNKLKQKTLEIIHTHPEINPDQVSLQTNFRDDLGVDSLIIAEIVIELEEAFDIQFPQEAMQEVQTVEDVLKYVERLAGK